MEMGKGKWKRGEGDGRGREGDMGMKEMGEFKRKRREVGGRRVNLRKLSE